jgi:hypothetical protein
MTRPEWDRIAAVLDNGFPGHFGDAESAAYWLLLGRRSARQVEDAVRKAVDKGLKYRPTPSELVRLMGTEDGDFIRSQFAACTRIHGVERAKEFFPTSRFPALLEETT